MGADSLKWFRIGMGMKLEVSYINRKLNEILMSSLKIFNAKFDCNLFQTNSVFSLQAALTSTRIMVRIAPDIK